MNQALALIRLRSVDSGEFLKWALTGPQVRDQVAIGRAALAQANLSLAQVGDLRVPLPQPQERCRIASSLDDITVRIVAEAGVLKSLGGTKAALSSALLTGEIRVPLDESAA